MDQDIARHKERRRSQKLRWKKRRKEKKEEERRLEAERRVNQKVSNLLQERMVKKAFTRKATLTAADLVQSGKKRTHPTKDKRPGASSKRGRIEAHPFKEIDTNHVVRTNQLLGSGTFGTCYLGNYRGLVVVIKELKIREAGNEGDGKAKERLKEELVHEAKAISKLGDHPGLPLLFGICSNSLPFKLIMQFHGCKDGSSLTICKAMAKLKIGGKSVWENILGKVAHALEHIHKVGLLHNDLKSNNVVLDEAVGHGKKTFQPIIIDFGKSRPIASPKGAKSLSVDEQRDYGIMYPHIAPEIVRGLHPQSSASDVYSFGYMAKLIFKNFKFGKMPEVMVMALRPNPSDRPTASKIHELLTK